ncbi:MAG: hypothetical protein CMH48_06860 [Muricauda sp.]|nr:SH3 domain-containing protein [Allomuricauda sp.]MAU26926.1 hypothetical protein [Allomuricauda sp.]MBC30551.1 hypothetical protein [Allomuricauda sp.]|tara:strand:+ start:11617 stop:12441 length:825 start_codon:yes stop_codon:yes gene_type:complete
MKTKQMLLSLTTLTICLFMNAQEKYHCNGDDCGFAPGEVVYLFGDDVKLRSQPTTESGVIKILDIGTELTVLEKTENSWPYRGIESPFYKVDYKGTTGYVLGGLISLEKKELNGSTYLFGYSRSGDLEYLNIRSPKPDGSFTENTLRLAHSGITIQGHGNKGLTGVDGILYINYRAEACGMQGGGIYCFQEGHRLIPAARLTQISEAGVFYRWETFVFPTDQEGVAGKILFKKEQGENLDDDSKWYKITTETRELVWANGRLVPDYKERPTNAM